MKFGRKMFFTRGLYKGPRTFSGLPGTFYRTFGDNFELVVFITFRIFEAKIMKCDWIFFSPDGCTRVFATLRGPPGTCLTVFMVCSEFSFDS